MSATGRTSARFEEAYNPIFVTKPFELKVQLANCRFAHLFGIPKSLDRVAHIWVRVGCGIVMEESQVGLDESSNQAVFVASNNLQLKFISRLVEAILKNPDYMPQYESIEEVQAAIAADDFHPEALPEALKSNHDLALFILLNHRELFVHFDRKLKNDSNFMLKLMQRDISFLGVPKEGKEVDKEAIFLGKKLRDDRDFMLKMLALAPRACRVASSKLRCLKEFMLPALIGDRRAYCHAGLNLLDDIEYMLAAMERDPDFIDSALKEGSHLNTYLGQNVRKDLCSMLAMIAKNPQAYKIAHRDLSANEDFVIPLLQALPAALPWVSETIRDNKPVRQALGIEKEKEFLAC